MAETFNFYSYAVIGDASIVLNPLNYIYNGIPSIGILSLEDVFNSTKYYTKGNLSFNILP